MNQTLRIGVLAVALAVPALVSAQGVPAPARALERLAVAPPLDMTDEGPQPGAPQQPRPGAAPAAPKEAPRAPVPERRPRGRDVNLRVELTIGDQSGTSVPATKVVSMILADGTSGRIRASADAQPQRANVGMVGTRLNVDARPTLIEGDRILLELTVEYAPLTEGEVTQRPTLLNEYLWVILQNDKPMIISQAADPVTDRKMTVEVKASIVK